MMPGLDGIELLRRIKNDSRLAGIPVIMQTAASSAEQIREGLEAGAYYYLTKPYRRDELLAIVHAALADARNRDALRRQLHRHIDALGFLDEGSFTIRTIDEADRLASFIAQACRRPGFGGHRHFRTADQRHRTRQPRHQLRREDATQALRYVARGSRPPQPIAGKHGKRLQVSLPP
jgi:response regulator RpfG family c-di-GMP phosphodiesterase